MTGSAKTGDAKEKLYELARKVEFAMLTTIDGDGSLHTRPMASQDIDGRGHIWFFTHKTSSAAQNIQANPKSSLGYSNPDDNTYVAIGGKGSLVDDQSIIDDKWSEDMKAWFPKGKNDPNIVLIRIEPEHGEYWDAASSTLTNVVGFVKASLGGERPDEMVDNQKVTF